MNVFQGANGNHSPGYNVIKLVLERNGIMQFEFFKLPYGPAVLNFVHGSQQKIARLELNESDTVESVIKRINDEINDNAQTQGQ